MAINFTDFSKIEPQHNGFANVFEDALKGYKIAEEPRTMKQNSQAKELANSLQKLALEHKPTEYALEDALKRAQAAKANRVGSTKTNIIKPNGKVANIAWVHDQLQNPNLDPTYRQQLEDSIKVAQIHEEATTANTQDLTNRRGFSQAPTIAKKEQIIMDADKGTFLGKPVTAQQAAKVKNDLLLSVVKDTTDSDTRKKLINATNLNITLGDVNPEKLTQYSGAKGQIKKIGDSIRESAGKGSRDYKDYVGEVQKAIAAAKQLRAYLGDSIQPSQQERLAHLTNPEAWNVSPALAAANFRYMKDLMQRESQTLVRAGTDPTLYQNAANPTGTQSHVGKTYNLATGRWE